MILKRSMEDPALKPSSMGKSLAASPLLESPQFFLTLIFMSPFFLIEQSFEAPKRRALRAET